MRQHERFGNVVDCINHAKFDLGGSHFVHIKARSIDVR
jgi:hypothetical protein